MTTTTLSLLFKRESFAFWQWEFSCFLSVAMKKKKKMRVPLGDFGLFDGP